MEQDTSPHLAWFVGDGTGARTRFDAVLPHLTDLRVSLVTVGPAGPAPAGVDRSVELPWAVLGGEPGSPRRDPSQLRAWLATDRPDLLVVDGNGAVSVAGRSVGVPTIRIRRPGAAPMRVSGAIEAIGTGELAPYPALLEPDATPNWLRERTVHAGFLSRFSGRRPHQRAGRRALGLDLGARVVTVLSGGDGLASTDELVAAARATPGWAWIVLGRCRSTVPQMPTNLHRLGWREDPWSALEAADVVVGSGALSVVAEVASAGRPLVLVPRRGRSSDADHAALLADARVVNATTRWPEPGEWRRLLERAASTEPSALSRLDDGRGPARAADWLRTWARSPSAGAPSGHAGTEVVGRPATPRRLIDLTEVPMSPSGEAHGGRDPRGR